MLLTSEEIPWSKGRHENVVEVVSALSEWGCCEKCILRFLCIKDHHILQSYGAENIADWLSFPEAQKQIFVGKTGNSSGIVCVVCLEILQEKFGSPSFILDVVKSVKKQEYEFEDFFCALTLPVSLLIREHSIVVALMEKFPDIFYSLDCKSIFTSIKDAWKWINGHKLAKSLGAPFSQRSPFEVQIFFEYRSNEKDCIFLADLLPRDSQRRRKYNRFNRNSITKYIKEISTEDFKKSYKTPLLTPSNGCYCEVIRCAHEAIFVAGRYNKYSRVLSQTPWFIEGVKKYESSVEEMICNKVIEKFQGKEHKFSSSGREDVDVRMLGRGRPFLIEVVNPKKNKVNTCEMRAIEETINKSTRDIFVRDLQVVSKEDTKHLKEGEEEKVKNYGALCLLRGPVSDGQLEGLSKMKDLQLAQKTPIRVLHRRPLATRMRTVHEMSATRLDDKLIVLKLSTQAGTYIKEFVHGDFGRTHPSLGLLLGCECDIIELDVDDVLLDWPPTIDCQSILSRAE